MRKEVREEKEEAKKAARAQKPSTPEGAGISARTITRSKNSKKTMRKLNKQEDSPESEAGREWVAYLDELMNKLESSIDIFLNE